MGKNEVHNYKITLKSVGGITQLPDSQRIFGALISSYARKNGDEKATGLVQAVYQKTIHLALSNLFPLDYLPMPFDYIVDQLAQNTSEEKSLKERREEVKKRAYIRVEDLKKVFHQPEEACHLFSYVTTCSQQQLRSSVDSALYGIGGLETKLYTVPVTELKEVKETGKASTVSEFCFYFQGSGDEITDSMLEHIQEMQNEREKIILGKRASQGLNLYRITAVKSIVLPEKKYYLNLGMLLPQKIDFDHSYLKLFTSERRPFEMAGGWRKSSGKYFISFIDSGSIVALQDKVEAAGNCVPSPFNRNRDIVFGNAFLYPIDWKEGVEK